MTTSTQVKTKLEYEVARSTQDPDEWRVEAIDYDDEGQVYVAIFAGPEAEDRAREYAKFKSA